MIKNSISAMNSVDKRYAVVKKACDLREGEFYTCEIIKKIHSRDYGTSYLIESSEFKLFLPKRYNDCEIPEFVRDRRFRIIGWMRNNSRMRDKKSPLIEFAILRDQDLDDEGRRSAPLNSGDAASPLRGEPDGDDGSRTSTSSSSSDEGRLTIVRGLNDDELEEESETNLRTNTQTTSV